MFFFLTIDAHCPSWLAQAFFIGFGVVGGIVFYQTGETMSSLEWGLHWFAAAMMIAGCVCLMKHGKEHWAKIQIKELDEVSRSGKKAATSAVYPAVEEEDKDKEEA